MTEAQVLALINQFIIANGNNEITANVLRPILEEMVKQPNDKIGDLPNLNTIDKTNIVAAINELINQGSTGFEIHAGSADPNVTPPASYSIGDWYMRNGSSLYQYNGNTWVLLGSSVVVVSADADNDLTVGGDGGAYFQERTAAEIKTAYESNPDTNAFTDDEKAEVSTIGGKLDSGGYAGTAQDIVNMIPDINSVIDAAKSVSEPFVYDGTNNIFVVTKKVVITELLDVQINNACNFDDIATVANDNEVTIDNTNLYTGDKIKLIYR